MACSGSGRRPQHRCFGFARDHSGAAGSERCELGEQAAWLSVGEQSDGNGSPSRKAPGETRIVSRSGKRHVEEIAQAVAVSGGSSKGTNGPRGRNRRPLVERDGATVRIEERDGELHVVRGQALAGLPAADDRRPVTGDRAGGMACRAGLGRREPQQNRETQRIG